MRGFWGGSWRCLVLVIAVVALGAAAGCKRSQPTPTSLRWCHMIGCHSGLRIRVAKGAHGFPLGTHKIAVTAGDATLACSFVFDAPVVATGLEPKVQCVPGLSLTFEMLVTCTDGSAEQVCMTTPGEFNEILEVAGTPGVVRVRQTADGTVVLDRTVTPSYITTQPNGPECSPICHQASLDWAFQ